MLQNCPSISLPSSQQEPPQSVMIKTDLYWALVFAFPILRESVISIVSPTRFLKRISASLFCISGLRRCLPGLWRRVLIKQLFHPKNDIFLFTGGLCGRPFTTLEYTDNIVCFWNQYLYSKLQLKSLDKISDSTMFVFSVKAFNQTKKSLQQQRNFKLKMDCSLRIVRLGKFCY